MLRSPVVRTTTGTPPHLQTASRAALPASGSEPRCPLLARRWAKLRHLGHSTTTLGLGEQVWTWASLSFLFFYIFSRKRDCFFIKVSARGFAHKYITNPYCSFETLIVSIKLTKTKPSEGAPIYNTYKYIWYNLFDAYRLTVSYLVFSLFGLKLNQPSMDCVELWQCLIYHFFFTK